HHGGPRPEGRDLRGQGPGLAARPQHGQALLPQLRGQPGPARPGARRTQPRPGDAAEGQRRALRRAPGPVDDLASLKKASYLLSLLDDRAVRRAEQLRAEGKAAEADALERDVLFAVRQRRQDVATQIAVTVQAYLSMGLIEDNNTKLQQGVERARTTTVTALRTA